MSNYIKYDDIRSLKTIRYVRQRSTTRISPRGLNISSAALAMPRKVRMKRERMMIGVPVLRYRAMAWTSEKKFNGGRKR